MIHDVKSDLIRQDFPGRAAGKLQAQFRGGYNLNRNTRHWNNRRYLSLGSQAFRVPASAGRTTPSLTLRVSVAPLHLLDFLADVVGHAD
ncbi:MAG: hypothetical protein L0220_20400, partial [Acidobacteria bacterium]|nr:hypothetical protein [Acidobacteriota bacterium]